MTEIELLSEILDTLNGMFVFSCLTWLVIGFGSAIVLICEIVLFVKHKKKKRLNNNDTNTNL